jgi:hypothetical protein
VPRPAAALCASKRLSCRLVRFLLSASLRFALRANLRLFEIVPGDFIAVFRLARHPPERFSTNC